jgi:FOP N terminal dimerisation domain
MQEINDLKNIVIQSLESNGVLSQLRAQIRSSVFKIIEDQESREGRSPAFFWENPLCQKIHKTTEGPIALELMHEFMEFYRMDFTCNVFVHEANYKATTERQALGTRGSPVNKLNIGNADPAKPLLATIIEKLIGGAINGASSAVPGPVQAQPVAPEKTALEKQIQADKAKFQKDKESIEAGLAEIKKNEERNAPMREAQKDKVSSGLSLDKNVSDLSSGNLGGGKQSSGDVKKDMPKTMMGAKKETEDIPERSRSGKDEHSKRDEESDDRAGKKASATNARGPTVTEPVANLTKKSEPNIQAAGTAASKMSHPHHGLDDFEASSLC